jgi:hypothetical protein
MFEDISRKLKYFNKSNSFGNNYPSTKNNIYLNTNFDGKISEFLFINLYWSNVLELDIDLDELLYNILKKNQLI